jgi:hypothetical protein
LRVQNTTQNKSGDYCEEVTPVPIPNTAVKLFSVDGSWGFPPVRVERRLVIEKTSAYRLMFFCVLKDKILYEFYYKNLFKNIISSFFIHILNVNLKKHRK